MLSSDNWQILAYHGSTFGTRLNSVVPWTSSPLSTKVDVSHSLFGGMSPTEIVSSKSPTSVSQPLTRIRYSSPSSAAQVTYPELNGKVSPAVPATQESESQSGPRKTESCISKVELTNALSPVPVPEILYHSPGAAALPPRALPHSSTSEAAAAIVDPEIDSPAEMGKARLH